LFVSISTSIESFTNIKVHVCKLKNSTEYRNRKQKKKGEQKNRKEAKGDACCIPASDHGEVKMLANSSPATNILGRFTNITVF
jgi:hypothetical protein